MQILPPPLADRSAAGLFSVFWWYPRLESLDPQPHVNAVTVLPQTLRGCNISVLVTKMSLQRTVEYIFRELPVYVVDLLNFVTRHTDQCFTADISIATTMCNGSDIASFFHGYQLCTPFIPSHPKPQLLWNVAVKSGCEEISHMFHAELNMHVRVSCQVPGLLFSLFNHSSEYGMRQTGLCIGFLINKTWGTLIQIKGILISSSGPLCLRRLNVRTKLRPISSWEKWVGRWLEDSGGVQGENLSC